MPYYKGRKYEYNKAGYAALAKAKAKSSGKQGRKGRAAKSTPKRGKR